MALPIRTTLDDIQAVCSFLATKPTGATVAQAKAVIDAKHLDGRKLTAMKFWGLIEEHEEGKLKVTSEGREVSRSSGKHRATIIRKVIRSVAPYRAIVERLAHRKENTINATDVAAHWHEHFKNEVSTTDKILNDQAVCFFSLLKEPNSGNSQLGGRGRRPGLTLIM